MKDSKVQKDVFPGQPLRFPVEKKGRHVPVSKASLLKILTIDAPEMVPDYYATD